MLTFGAVCARCNHNFSTDVWPPRYDLCPRCLHGATAALFRDRESYFWGARPSIGVAGGNWGAGS